MMKTIITLIMGLALCGSLSAQQEKTTTGGACCAKGSSRAAMMSGVPADGAMIKKVVTKDHKNRATHEKGAGCEKCAKKSECAGCKDGKMCPICAAEAKERAAKSGAEKRDACKKVKTQRKFTTDPAKIDLRKVKLRLGQAKSK